MKPYDSFDQQNYHNGTENNLSQNAHPGYIENDYSAAPFPFENQIMDVRTPPGGASRRHGRRKEEAHLI
ncbi:hypothetical protein QUF86_25345 [Peribacillus sp. NJ11]|uniref:hypothetical protein n=1 Tax=Peribacillus sp. NJ11 TaxID=3055861 RepID=UPI0025A0B9AC|nr:hypothetical protein [Peribacillus sp. NJ11]MDM5224002.1 hypothetical protein [Peribacillus sp. NJ11]